MGLAECRRFSLLPDALVARSALEAAGLHPIVFDQFRASIVWTEQIALGGVRLMVPEQELAPARAFLSDVHGAPPTAKATAPVKGSPTLFLVLFVASLLVGWPIAGFRLRDRFHRLSALVTSVGLILILLLPWISYHLAYG